jgi:hypothetical protein
MRPGLLAAMVLALAPPVTAQSRFHVGAALTASSEPASSVSSSVGGTTWSGSVMFGARIVPRVSIEFEPSFAGTFRREYTYPPSLSTLVHVDATRRDDAFTSQVRVHAGVLEPVVGFSYVRRMARWHATYVPGGRLYFDDRRADTFLAFVAGIDAALKVGPRVAIVPTFRMMARPTGDIPVRDPTNAGWLVFRYGAGARVSF